MIVVYVVSWNGRWGDPVIGGVFVTVEDANAFRVRILTDFPTTKGCTVCARPLVAPITDWAE